jgi:hypothetical protein
MVVCWAWWWALTRFLPILWGDKGCCPIIIFLFISCCFLVGGDQCHCQWGNTSVAVSPCQHSRVPKIALVHVFIELGTNMDVNVFEGCLTAMGCGLGYVLTPKWWDGFLFAIVQLHPSKRSCLLPVIKVLHGLCIKFLLALPLCFFALQKGSNQGIYGWWL